MARLGALQKQVENVRQHVGRNAILDGEACVLDELGRSDFNRLQARWRRRRWFEGCDAKVGRCSNRR